MLEIHPWLKESVINKMRKHQTDTAEVGEIDNEHEDDFDKIYKGEVSKSGTAILPSKRTKRIQEKFGRNLKNLTNENNDKSEKPKQQEEPKSLNTDNTSKE